MTSKLFILLLTLGFAGGTALSTPPSKRSLKPLIPTFSQAFAENKSDRLCGPLDTRLSNIFGIFDRLLSGFEKNLLEHSLLDEDEDARAQELRKSSFMKFKSVLDAYIEKLPSRAEDSLKRRRENELLQKVESVYRDIGPQIKQHLKNPLLKPAYEISFKRIFGLFSKWTSKEETLLESAPLPRVVRGRKVSFQRSFHLFGPIPEQINHMIIIFIHTIESQAAKISDDFQSLLQKEGAKFLYNVKQVLCRPSPHHRLWFLRQASKDFGGNLRKKCLHFPVKDVIPEVLKFSNQLLKGIELLVSSSALSAQTIQGIHDLFDRGLNPYFKALLLEARYNFNHTAFKQLVDSSPVPELFHNPEDLFLSFQPLFYAPCLPISLHLERLGAPSPHLQPLNAVPESPFQNLPSHAQSAPQDPSPKSHFVQQASNVLPREGSPAFNLLEDAPTLPHPPLHALEKLLWKDKSFQERASLSSVVTRKQSYLKPFPDLLFQLQDAKDKKEEDFPTMPEATRVTRIPPLLDFSS